MSKIIKITPECLAEIRKEFEETLGKAKAADGKISFTKTFNYISRKAVVYFNEVAWLKMQSLIKEFDKEVAWHGVAYRGEDQSKDEYYITDILVYPQEVTGATVNTDQEKYEMWLMQHDDDVFNNIRMQGHSHVNMGTTPSGVDTTHQEKILDQLEDDMFYIFMIWNKKGDKTIKIYDLAKNILFDGSDVSVEVMDGDLGLDKFIKDAKDMVKDKMYSPSQNKIGYTGYGYGGYGGSYSRPADNTKSIDTKANQCYAGKSGKKKGKRKKNGKSSTNPNNACNGEQQSLFNWYDEYNDGYPYHGWWG